MAVPILPVGGVVNFSVVPLEFDTGGEFDEDIADGTVFTDYEIINRYERDNHVYMMGITSPDGFQGSSAAFVQLAAPTTLMISDWTACKIGSKPKLPDSETFDSRLILLDEHFDAPKVVAGPDGSSPLYRISGRYIYGFKNGSKEVFRDIAIPRPPWIESDAFVRNLDGGDFQKDLIDPNTMESPGLTTGDE